MSRIKPYKAKRRIADFLALKQAREEAIDTYRRGLMETFDIHQMHGDVTVVPGPGTVRDFPKLIGVLRKAVMTTLIADDSSPHSRLRSQHMLDHARRGAAMKMAQYLMGEGFIMPTSEAVPGVGHRLTFAIYAAKLDEVKQ